ERQWNEEDIERSRRPPADPLCLRQKADPEPGREPHDEAKPFTGPPGAAHAQPVAVLAHVPHSCTCGTPPQTPSSNSPRHHPTVSGLRHPSIGGAASGGAKYRRRRPAMGAAGFEPATKRL